MTKDFLSCDRGVNQSPDNPPWPCNLLLNSLTSSKACRPWEAKILSDVFLVSASSLLPAVGLWMFPDFLNLRKMPSYRGACKAQAAVVALHIFTDARPVGSTFELSEDPQHLKARRNTICPFGVSWCFCELSSVDCF